MVPHIAALMRAIRSSTFIEGSGRFMQEDMDARDRRRHEG
jgi:hypothetical protein